MSEYLEKIKTDLWSRFEHVDSAHQVIDDLLKDYYIAPKGKPQIAIATIHEDSLTVGELVAVTDDDHGAQVGLEVINHHSMRRLAKSEIDKFLETGHHLIKDPDREAGKAIAIQILEIE